MRMKQCKNCKGPPQNAEIGHPDCAFAKSARKKDGLQPWCKKCVKDSDHRRYMADKKKHRSWNMSRRDKYYDLVTEYLQEHPCVSCGEADPIVLEFDHRDPGIKDSEVTRLLSYASWERILDEIKKCDVVCSNCHRKRTAQQFGWRRWQQAEEQMEKPTYSDEELDAVIIDD